MAVLRGGTPVPGQTHSGSPVSSGPPAVCGPHLSPRMSCSRSDEILPESDGARARSHSPLFLAHGKDEAVPKPRTRVGGSGAARLPRDLGALVQSVCQELFGVQSPCIFIPFYHVNCSELLCFCNKKSPFSKNGFVQTCPFNSQCAASTWETCGVPL